MSKLHLEDFNKIFTARRDYCQEVLALSQQQAALIEQSDFTALLRVLGKKQRILGELDHINERFPNLKTLWKTSRDEFDPAERSDCEHLLAEIESLLQELIQEEQSSTNRLVEKRENTKQELETISKGTQVHSAYRDHLASTTHRHLDINS